jgi:hypothetical protein
LAQYSFNGHTNLSPGELFFWVVVDTTMDHLGVDDVIAVAAIVSGQPLVHTRAKFGGATPGTSPASSFLARNLNVRLPFRLPTLTGASLRTLRVTFTNNLGRFVGRTIPVVGWLYLAADVGQILYRSVMRYNGLARREDRLW